MLGHKMAEHPSGGQRAPLHHTGEPTPPGGTTMPARGYRKGVSDAKVPRPHLLRCRASTTTRTVLEREADSRGLTLSALLAELADAHATRRASELPHHRGLTRTVVGQLERIGNNLNQVAYQANVMHLHLIHAKAHKALDAVLGFIDDLRA